MASIQGVEKRRNVQAQKMNLPNLTRGLQTTFSKLPEKKKFVKPPNTIKLKQTNRKFKKNNDFRLEYHRDKSISKQANSPRPTMKMNRWVALSNNRANPNKSRVMRTRRAINRPSHVSPTPKRMFVHKNIHLLKFPTRQKNRFASPGLNTKFSIFSPAKRNIFTPKKKLSRVSPAKYEVFTKDCPLQSGSRYENSIYSSEDKEEKELKSVFANSNIKLEKVIPKPIKDNIKDTSKQLYNYLNDVAPETKPGCAKSSKPSRKDTNFFYELSKTVQDNMKTKMSRNNYIQGDKKRKEADIFNFELCDTLQNHLADTQPTTNCKKPALTFIDSTLEEILGEYPCNR
ncbi:unnamed protein product [Moneuplotes crassus]|uniref:Uncharacterized protein n=1 Tax=Euplotes crassus TaxID=5936 RepID=A0AAD1U8F9_EUPCR|nr:unnamed protein product [Moneuplotes crassus]